MTETNHRSIADIASDVRRDWRKPNYAAVPYLDAMRQLDRVDDMYLYDSARDIVLRFLGNASSWRGETARRVKAELRGMLK